MKAKFHASEEKREQRMIEREREFWRMASFGCSYKGWGRSIAGQPVNNDVEFQLF